MEHFESFQDRIESLFDDVKAIKKALLGDEFNQNGYVKRLEKVEDQQNEFKQYRQRIIGAVIALNTIGAIIMAIIGIYFKLHNQ